MKSVLDSSSTLTLNDESNLVCYIYRDRHTLLQLVSRHAPKGPVPKKNLANLPKYLLFTLSSLTSPTIAVAPYMTTCILPPSTPPSIHTHAPASLLGTAASSPPDVCGSNSNG